jgi:hypothetical protein
MRRDESKQRLRLYGRAPRMVRSGSFAMARRGGSWRLMFLRRDGGAAGRAWHHRRDHQPIEIWAYVWAYITPELGLARACEGFGTAF